MARIFKDQFGQYVAVKDDGTRTPINPSQLEQAERLRDPAPKPGAAPNPALAPSGEADPFIVRNEQGVDPSERAIVKNFAANPAVAQKQLEDWGYDVRPYGNHPTKMQFAVRPRGKTGVWKVVDPDGFDWQDILDLGGDILSGTINFGAMAAAAPAAIAAGIPTAGAGGLAVESAASAVGGAAGETARQGIGTMLGIKNNTDTGQIGTAAVVGGAMPVALKIASPAIRGVSNAVAYGFERTGYGLRYAAAKFAGVKDLPAMSVRNALDIVSNRAGSKVVPIADQAKAVYRLMMDKESGILNETWPEVEQVNHALVAAKDQGAKMDFSPIIDNLQKMAGSDAAGMAEKRGAGRAASEFDATFKKIRKNPEFEPSPEMAAKEPLLTEAVRARDAKLLGIERRGGGAVRPNAAATQPIDKGAVADAADRFAQANQGRGPSAGANNQLRRMVDRMGAAERQTAARGGAAESDTDVWSRIVGELTSETQPIPKVGAAAAQPIAVAAAPTAAASSMSELAQPAARKQVTELLNHIVQRIQGAGASLSEVPLDLAHQLKRHVQDIARRGGAYADNPVSDAFVRVGRDAAASIRQGIIDGMPADLKGDFVDALGRFERKTKLRGAMLSAFRSPSSVEAFLREVHGKSNASAAVYLDGLEKEFGISLKSELDFARAGELMDKASPGAILRRHPFAAGAALFHPSTGLPIVGGVLGAPIAGKGLQAAGRGIAAAGGIAAEASSRVAASPAATAAAVKILQDSLANTGKGVASESQASHHASRKRVTRLF